MTMPPIDLHEKYNVYVARFWDGKVEEEISSACSSIKLNLTITHESSADIVLDYDEFLSTTGRSSFNSLLEIGQKLVAIQEVSTGEFLFAGILGKVQNPIGKKQFTIRVVDVVEWFKNCPAVMTGDGKIIDSDDSVIAGGKTKTITNGGEGGWRGLAEAVMREFVEYRPVGYGSERIVRPSAVFAFNNFTTTTERKVKVEFFNKNSVWEVVQDICSTNGGYELYFQPNMLTVGETSNLYFDILWGSPQFSIQRPVDANDTDELSGAKRSFDFALDETSKITEGNMDYDFLGYFNSILGTGEYFEEIWEPENVGYYEESLATLQFKEARVLEESPKKVVEWVRDAQAPFTVSETTFTNYLDDLAYFEGDSIPIDFRVSVAERWNKKEAISWLGVYCILNEDNVHDDKTLPLLRRAGMDTFFEQGSLRIVSVEMELARGTVVYGFKTRELNADSLKKYNLKKPIKKAKRTKSSKEKTPVNPWLPGQPEDGGKNIGGQWGFGGGDPEQRPTLTKNRVQLTSQSTIGTPWGSTANAFAQSEGSIFFVFVPSANSATTSITYATPDTAPTIMPYLGLTGVTTIWGGFARGGLLNETSVVFSDQLFGTVDFAHMISPIDFEVEPGFKIRQVTTQISHNSIICSGGKIIVPVITHVTKQSYNGNTWVTSIPASYFSFTTFMMAEYRGHNQPLDFYPMANSFVAGQVTYMRRVGRYGIYCVNESMPNTINTTSSASYTIRIVDFKNASSITGGGAEAPGENESIGITESSHWILPPLPAAWNPSTNTTTANPIGQFSYGMVPTLEGGLVTGIIAQGSYSYPTGQPLSGIHYYFMPNANSEEAQDSPVPNTSSMEWQLLASGTAASTPLGQQSNNNGTPFTSTIDGRFLSMYAGTATSRLAPYRTYTSPAQRTAYKFTFEDFLYEFVLSQTNCSVFRLTYGAVDDDD